MKTAIVFYSQHHGNTRKLVDAIKSQDPEVRLIDVSETKVSEIEGYDYIGVASGIYFGKLAKPLMEYLKAKLPSGKGIFAIYTCGTKSDKYTNELKELVRQKNCVYHGDYGCLGFDTFGPFKLVGGIAKGRPDETEIQGAVEFYKSITG